MQFSTFSVFSIVAVVILSLQATAAPTLDSRSVLVPRCGGSWFRRSPACVDAAVLDEPAGEESA
ncbi:hypothetical protein FA95DRAFT_1607057 [Auriscalpium vulgare]|uniref:Uncharacterized protein n=1 Tax=Auriscalpium vulgare TaxID=40419 RepID=A0ACB8RQG3_9AGAM|nr:hypothetical protein FA95DRAFT_1607057 [Auriscalpium vulgare]